MSSDTPLSGSWRSRVSPEYRTMLEKSPHTEVRASVYERLNTIPAHVKRDSVETMIDLVTTAVHMLENLQVPEKEPDPASFEALGYRLIARPPNDPTSEAQAFALLQRADRLYEKLCAEPLISPKK